MKTLSHDSQQSKRWPQDGEPNILTMPLATVVPFLVKILRLDGVTLNPVKCSW